MTGLVIGATLAVVATWWVIAPIFPRRARRPARD
jgi:hypothetical protein